MMTPFDAWIVRRLLCDRDVNTDDREMVSGPFRALVNHLAGLLIDRRDDGLAGFLAGRADREAVEEAIGDADPDGPRPEPIESDDQADDGWGPIRYKAPPEAVPFPMDVLPVSARELAEAASKAIGCPVDFPAMACLAAASVAIGRSAIVLVKPGYFETASLYLALVADPSVGKTPAINAAMAPIHVISRTLEVEYRKAIEACKAIPKDERGEQPTMRRITTSDPTTEALAPILARNPRGMVVLPDEMTRWVMSMDQYRGGKGGDRAFWMMAWSGSRICVDRKGKDEPIIVAHPLLCVVGGMTPDMLSSLTDGREDGFTARLLFAYPERTLRIYTEEGISEGVEVAWRETIEALWRRPMVERDGQTVSHVVKMTPEARRAWGEWCQAHIDETQSDDLPQGLQGAWGKFEAYAARLALVLHLLSVADDPTVSPYADPPELPTKIIDDTARLVVYLKSQTRRVHAEMAGRYGDGGKDVRDIAGWIIRRGPGRGPFSRSDITSDLRRFTKDDAALVDALDWMVKQNLIRHQDQKIQGETRRSGRKPNGKYEANPALWDAPGNTRNTENPSGEDASPSGRGHFLDFSYFLVTDGGAA